jgi:hypothetical protein
MSHTYMLEPSAWIGLVTALAGLLVLLAGYGLCVVTVAVEGRRPV